MLGARTIVAVAMLIGATSPAFAGGPEQLEQLEPAKGEWQIEYFGLFGSGSDEREHSIQAMVGVSDELALGAEMDSSWTHGSLNVEGLAATVFYRFRDTINDAIGSGVVVQAGFDRHAHFTGTEARLIVEKRSLQWWAQGDLILRYVRSHGASATSVAYGWALNRAVARNVWLGLEGSGQAVRLGGLAQLAPEGEHFLGPSLTYEMELHANREVEFGIAYLRRLAAAGPSNTARVFIQLSF